MNELIRRVLLALFVISSALHASVLINSITVSTLDGYPEEYVPGSFNYFGLLGAPLQYHLSDGESRVAGAGWTPYTNGDVASQTITSDGHIAYQFENLTNWAKGSGVLFYHVGQVWNYTTDDLWSEGVLLPASPLILETTLGSTTATLSGLAQIAFNNPSNNWGGNLAEFVPYAAPEGSIVPFTATYTLLNGATWQPDIFQNSFEYTMLGTISFVPEPTSSVPEPSPRILVALGVLSFLMLTRFFGRSNRSGEHVQDDATC